MRRVRAVLIMCVTVVALTSCTDVVNGRLTGSGAPTSRASASSGSPTGNGSVPDFTGGVVVGNGPVRVTSYDDLACPPCARLEAGYAAVIASAVAAGKARFTFFDLAFLDAVSNGSRYSSRAANAALCAAQVGTTQYLAFKQAVLAAQPPEGSTGLTDAQLVAIGQRSGIGGADFATCVTSSRFAGQVATITRAAATQRVESVPTVLVNGVAVQDPTSASIAKAIAAAR